jgi:FMN hydrolase / 5-amino-6-(5-phospho-D-ribitylamino)uracil phosphatase
MKTIGDIKVISVDLFRTLAMVDDGYSYVWQTFLQDRYEPELGQKYWDRTTEILLARLDEAAAVLEPFKTTGAIFAESYAQCFQEIGLQYDPYCAAETLFEIHKLGRFYPDARPFLEKATQRFEVCLASDCDMRMLEGLDQLFAFKKIFASEELRAYKAHPRFFSQVLDYYQIQPQQLLHIGDSKMDILTPARMGILTCWLNRAGLPSWKYPVQPDFIVKSLMDVLPIVGL